MANIKLTYFDFHGGRGETARLALTLGGIAFEDDRVKFSEWKSRRTEMPYQAMPVLTVDGQSVAQSNGINRYVGKLASLYPSDPWQAALCDEVMDVVEDIAEETSKTFGLEGEEMKEAREALADGPLSFYLKQLGRRLEERGGDWFADGRLTVADLKVFLSLRHIRSGNLDHVPTDLAERVAPNLVEHFERVKSNPAIAKYYGDRGVA